MNSKANNRTVPVRAARRLRLKLLGMVNTARLVGTRPRGERWIFLGDSHSIHAIDTEFPSPRVGYRDRRHAALYLGPRLLHSVAVRGWPPWALRLLRVLRGVAPRESVTRLVVVLGEIDVRCHLAVGDRRAGIEALADATIDRVLDLPGLLPPGSSVIVCVPLPPSRRYASAEAFPIVGSIEERLAVLEELGSALAGAVERAQTTDVVLFDPRPLVAAPDGELREDLTFDGCHLSSPGSAILRTGLVQAVRAHETRPHRGGAEPAK